MATSRISTYIGDQDPAVTVSVGVATVQGNVELTIDFAAVVNADGTTRKMTREECLEGIERIKRYLIQHAFPIV